MIRDITLGQYFNAQSYIHSIDPRVKIVLTILLMVMIFFCKNIISITVLVAFVVFCMLNSSVPIRMYLKGLKPIIIIVALTCILNLFYGTGEPILQIGFITITINGVLNSLYVAIRIIMLLMISSILTFTTSPTDLTDGLGRLLSPLAKLKINVYDIAMMISIALRFIPTLLEETDKIINAQKSRGANFDSGNLIKRVKAFVPVLIPLFVSSFRRAYDLAMAMECRCYKSGQARTRMKILVLGKNDAVAMVLTLLISIAIVVFNSLQITV